MTKFFYWTHKTISPSTTGVATAVLCAVCHNVHIKDPLLLERIAHEMMAMGFLTLYLNGP